MPSSAPHGHLHTVMHIQTSRCTYTDVKINSKNVKAIVTQDGTVVLLTQQAASPPPASFFSDY